MNVWFFIILVLAMALIVGPIAMLRPKPAQRHKEGLRLHAAGQGVRFSMRTLPKLKTATGDPHPSPVYYLPPHPKMQFMPSWTLVRTDYPHEGNFYQEWDWHGEHRPSPAVCDLLLKNLPALPTSVGGLTQGEGGTCIFWREKESTEMLDQLIALMRELHSEAARGITTQLP